MTIDAMGCQVAIADKIVAHKADYLLALKGDQLTLETEVEDYFRTAPADELVTRTTVEKGHGRIETRFYTASAVVDWIKSDGNIRGSPGSTASRPWSGSSTGPNSRIAAPLMSGSSSRPPASTSSASPRAFAGTGASKACTGC